MIGRGSKLSPFSDYNWNSQGTWDFDFLLYVEHEELIFVNSKKYYEENLLFGRDKIFCGDKLYYKWIKILDTAKSKVSQIVA